MSRNLPLPFFPSAPDEYNPQFMREVVRAMSIYMQNMQNPGEGRNTRLTITNLPDTDQGLEPGALFEQGGFVKVSKANAPHVVGLSAAGNVGAVTVVAT